MKDRESNREMRVRVRIDKSASPSIGRRLDELDMDISTWIRWLIEKDIGVKA